MVKLAKTCCLLFAAAALGVGGVVSGQSTDSTVIGISRPSEESRVSFESTGKVVEIPVKEGQLVKAGETLIQLDVDLEQKKLEQLEIESKSNLTIEAEEKGLANAQVTFRRAEELHARGAATDAELEEKQLAVDIQEIKLRKAREDLELKKLERDAQMVAIRQKKLDSKIDGVVAKIEVVLGEVVDPREPAVTVVRNDPLWVEFNLPSRQAAALGKTQTLPVRYFDSEASSEGRVIFLSPVVDATSDTRKVRLEVPNPQNRPSGLQMLVTLPDDVVAAGRDPAEQADAGR